MAALFFGLTRPAAVRFAFPAGIPDMLAAGGWQIMETMKNGQTSALSGCQAVTAFATATFMAWVSVEWLPRFVQTMDFVPFAWYRFALGLALIALLSVGRIVLYKSHAADLLGEAALGNAREFHVPFFYQPTEERARFDAPLMSIPVLNAVEGI